ncbi:MAG: CPBP family intramembrane metalloprotease [Bacteroidales bacterium]|nr:CPBP family intramembrane metalloprotease [Bacteroidales bacterium]MBR6875995.1 CPBP family intramembrane metalloprotease [Bacteroidales bacterium]
MANRKGPRNYGFYEKFSYYLPGVADMFILLALLLLGTLLGSLLTIPFVALLGHEASSQYATFISYPLMFIPPMIYASIKSRNASMVAKGLKLDSSHFSPLGGTVCAILVMLGTLALGMASDPLTNLLPQMPAWLEDTLKGLTSSDNFLINFLLVSLFAPFFEEWLCRGIILRGLLGNHLKPIWAIVISAAFFAFIHLNPWQALPAFLLGCLFGYVYYKTGSLQLTMLMHFTNNTFALVMANIDAFKDADKLSDVIGGQPYWILVAASTLLVVLIVRAFRRIPLEKTEGNFDPVKPLFEE